MASVVSHAKRTIGVNAAFLQEVKDSNLQLWATLRELREIKPGTEDVREATRVFVNKLGDLRDSVALEFSLEETYGFIEGANVKVGFGVADAATARMQHSDLYLQLHEICEKAEEAQYRGTIGRDFVMFVAAFEAFDRCFRAHEELEAELIRCGLGVRN